MQPSAMGAQVKPLAPIFRLGADLSPAIAVSAFCHRACGPDWPALFQSGRSPARPLKAGPTRYTAVPASPHVLGPARHEATQMKFEIEYCGM